jgi:hypothetical protein
MNKHELLTNPIYKKMNLNQLAWVIGCDLGYTDYLSLNGLASSDKAKILMKKWNQEVEDFQEDES